MAKLRKMLGSANSAYIISLMRLIETQSKTTIVTWCVNYAKENILPIYEELYPEDMRLGNALNAAMECLEGKIKLAEAKKIIREANAIAKEVADNPVALAATRSVAVAAGSISTITNSLGYAFYGAAAIAYSRFGLDKSDEEYDAIAAEECGKMEAALRAIAVEDEANPVKVNWNC